MTAPENQVAQRRGEGAYMGGVGFGQRPFAILCRFFRMSPETRGNLRVYAISMGAGA